MRRVLALIPAEKIYGLLADREFVGNGWFKLLDGQDIFCRLRIKGNTPVLGICGKDIEAKAEVTQ
ncbi:hypothetical protein CI610_00153 [invertebrate metagenome]|uniref:Uncharacterized protein n=1 Tax=invertebrate metagenome TaxID=1711999 RepID=A0A2H9TC32_9ZZZZ